MVHRRRQLQGVEYEGLSPMDHRHRYLIQKSVFRSQQLMETCSGIGEEYIMVGATPIYPIGIGSTILTRLISSSIIEEAMALRDAGLGLTAYYYFDFRSTAKQDVRGLLSSLLVQLCTKSDSCYKVLFDLYATYDNGFRLPENKALVQSLREMLKLPAQPTIYLIVDALDECPSTSRDRVLDLIENLVESSLSNLRICVTSRPETEIRESLGPLASHTISLHEEDGQREDMVSYVTYFVNSDRKMRKWSEEDKTLVINTISEKADGM